jgi:ABC-type glycerol-3-phosphate transport system permease component
MAPCIITLLPVLAVFLIFRTSITEGVAFTGMKYGPQCPARVRHAL